MDRERDVTDTFEYAVPADEQSAPKSSIFIALTAVVGFLAVLFTVAAHPLRS